MNYHDWISKERNVEARDAQGNVVATGTARAYSTVPQVLIVDDQGKRTWWRADMTHEAPPPGPIPGLYYSHPYDMYVVVGSDGHPRPINEDFDSLVTHTGHSSQHLFDVWKCQPVTSPSKEGGPLTVEMEKLGIRHSDMDRIVQRAARLEAHGITDRDVDRIVWQWYRDAAEMERTARPEGDS